MSQLQPVLTALNRSLEHLGQQVGALGRDVAALQSDRELDRAARQRLDVKLEQVSEQITDMQMQIETQQRDTDDRLFSLQHNVTSLMMDLHLKQATRATLEQSTEEQQPSGGSALWEAVERLERVVVNNTAKVSGLMEDLPSGTVRQLERDLKELREQMEQKARNAQIQYMMTGLEVEDAKVTVLRQVGELAANLTLHDTRLQEMDVDVDYLYTALYRNSSAGDCAALKASLARLEKTVVNVTELANDNRLALEENSGCEVERWSVPAVEALQHGLQQVKESLVSEQSRTRSLNHSLAQLSGSVTACLADVSDLKGANRKLWEETQSLSAWFTALVTDVSRHGEVLGLLLGDEVLEFMQWPSQDREAQSIPALKQQLTEHDLKIKSLLANRAGAREEQPSADQPSSSSHRLLPGAVGPARERQLLLHPGSDLQNLDERLELLGLKVLRLEERPCGCTDTSTGRPPAALEATLQEEVLWLKRGLEHHLSLFKNVFSNADELVRSNNTLELDRLWELVKNKDGRRDKRRGGNRSRRDSADAPSGRVLVASMQFMATSPRRVSPNSLAFKPIRNQGQFHPETGSFTAPVDGTYVFILTLDLRPGRVHVVLRRLSGGPPVSLLQAEMLEAGPRTGVGFLLLRAGDGVRLQLRRGGWKKNRDNTFIGLLLP